MRVCLYKRIQRNYILELLLSNALGVIINARTEQCEGSFKNIRHQRKGMSAFPDYNNLCHSDSHGRNKGSWKKLLRDFSAFLLSSNILFLPQQKSGIRNLPIQVHVYSHSSRLCQCCGKVVFYITQSSGTWFDLQ